MHILCTMIVLSNRSSQTCRKIIQFLLADVKRVVVGGEGEDRISELPANVIDRILELLPVKDAAKTRLRRSSYAHIDRWMLNVTRNDVKELYLHMPDNSSYKLPSYVLNCPTLKKLKLFNCVFKPPNPFVGSRHLITIRLESITFVPTTEFIVINCPLLLNLALLDCRGTQYLKIFVSSWLEYLLQLEIDEVVDNPNREHDERSTLEKLLLSVAATLEFLLMGLGYFELLTADTMPKGPPFTRLQELSLGIDFGKLSQTTCALQLIKSCPNLSKLQLWGCASRESTEAVLKYLKRPITCLDLRLNELKYVGISSHECSKTELLFVKLLFACTPSLVRMCYEQQKPFDSSDERKLTSKLMCFSRASPSIFRIRRLRTTTCIAYIMRNTRFTMCRITGAMTISSSVPCSIIKQPLH
ncbi:hypothetical protein BC332_02767 [Capsicum chinense]|nr:hypothetical protein BC332_02767 [Capsicum chinense]